MNKYDYVEAVLHKLDEGRKYVDERTAILCLARQHLIEVLMETWDEEMEADGPK